MTGALLLAITFFAASDESFEGIEGTFRLPTFSFSFSTDATVDGSVLDAAIAEPKTEEVVVETRESLTCSFMAAAGDLGLNTWPPTLPSLSVLMARARRGERTGDCASSLAAATALAVTDFDACVEVVERGLPTDNDDVGDIEGIVDRGTGLSKATSSALARTFAAI
jgi:hypothetical protein